MAAGAGEGAVGTDGKAQVDVEVAAGVVAAGGRHEQLADVGVAVGPARQVVEAPGHDLRPAVHRILDLVGRQVEGGVQNQVTRPHVEAIVAADGVARHHGVVLQEANGLNLRTRGVVEQLVKGKAVDVAVGVQDIDVDVVVALTEGHHRPVDHVADVGVGGNEAAGGGVGQILVVLVVDGLRNRAYFDVMILPEIALRIAHRDLPVEVVAGGVVLDVDHLAARPVVDRCT